MYKNLIDVAKRIVAIANTREQNQQEGFFHYRILTYQIMMLLTLTN